MKSPTSACVTSGANVWPAFPTATVCVTGPDEVDVPAVEVTDAETLAEVTVLCATAVANAAMNARLVRIFACRNYQNRFDGSVRDSRAQYEATT